MNKKINELLTCGLYLYQMTKRTTNIMLQMITKTTKNAMIRFQKV